MCSSLSLLRTLLIAGLMAYYIDNLLTRVACLRQCGSIADRQSGSNAAVTAGSYSRARSRTGKLFRTRSSAGPLGSFGRFNGIERP